MIGQPRDQLTSLQCHDRQAPKTAPTRRPDANILLLSLRELGQVSTLSRASRKPLGCTGALNVREPKALAPIPALTVCSSRSTEPFAASIKWRGSYGRRKVTVGGI